MVSQRERLYMATNKTAKPCPSFEQKELIFGWFLSACQIFNALKSLFGYIDDDLLIIIDWLVNFFQ